MDNPINILGNYFVKLLDNKMIKIIQKKIKNPKIGYLALNCEFKNNLPGNDANLIHTDDNSSLENKTNLLKIAIPFHLMNNDRFEFRQICIHKKKISNVKQYMTLSEIPKNIKKKIQAPNIKCGDAIIFDPNNFFHFGAKTKYNVRIVLTIVVIDKKHPMKNKAKEFKINNNILKSLSKNQKNFCSLFLNN